MLRWALIFFVVSIIAGVFGFTGIATGSAAVAKVLFFAALFIFMVFLIVGIVLERKVTTKL